MAVRLARSRGHIRDVFEGGRSIRSCFKLASAACWRVRNRERKNANVQSRRNGSRYADPERFSRQDQVSHVRSNRRTTCRGFAYEYRLPTSGGMSSGKNGAFDPAAFGEQAVIPNVLLRLR